MAVPSVENIHELPRGGTFFVDTDRQQVYRASLVVFVKQIHRQGVVNIISDVRLHDEVNSGRF